MKKLIIFMFSVVLFGSCSKEDDLDLIFGKWEVTNITHIVDDTAVHYWDNVTQGSFNYFNNLYNPTFATEYMKVEYYSCSSNDTNECSGISSVRQYHVSTNQTLGTLDTLSFKYSIENEGDSILFSGNSKLGLELYTDSMIQTYVFTLPYNFGGNNTTHTNQYIYYYKKVP